MRQKLSHICQKLSALVTVQQDYMHITSDNKEFQPALIRLNSTILYWSEGKRLTAKKYAFK